MNTTKICIQEFLELGFLSRLSVLISLIIVSSLQVAIAQDQETEYKYTAREVAKELKIESNVVHSKTTTRLIRKPTSPNEEKRLAKLRTREGRLSVKPLDWNATIGKRKHLPKQLVKPEKLKRTKPNSASGGKPNPKAGEEARKLHPEDWRLMMQNSLQDTKGRILLASLDIFTQYCENCPNVNTDAPEAAIGRLFTNAGSCSASVISGNNIIVTAAHCCWDRNNNNWIGGWSFAPGYHQGNAPYGTFDWSSARILNSWADNGDRQSDVCLITLQNDSLGRGVTFFTGWLGRSWDWSAAQNHHVLGYPGNIGNANVLEACTSESSGANAFCGGDGVLNTGCSMTNGASGGPWILNYRTDNWVNAVVSGWDENCTGTFGKTFNGSRFTSSNIAILCNDEGCD